MRTRPHGRSGSTEPAEHDIGELDGACLVHVVPDWDWNERAVGYRSGYIAELVLRDVAGGGAKNQQGGHTDPTVLKDEGTARSAPFRPRPPTPRTTTLLVIVGIVERVRGQRAGSLAVRVGQHVPRALVVKGPELRSSGNEIEDDVSGHAT